MVVVVERKRRLVVVQEMIAVMRREVAASLSEVNALFAGLVSESMLVDQSDWQSQVTQMLERRVATLVPTVWYSTELTLAAERMLW